MVYNFVSIKRIIAKVFTDLDLKEETHRISDFLSWGAEALLKIGAFPQFINKVAGKGTEPLLPLTGYQAKLPGDFYKLIQVAYSTSESGPFHPMRYATGSFEYERELESETDTSVDNVIPTSDIVNLAMDLYNLTYADALAKINSEPGTRDSLAGLLASTDSSGDSKTTYTDDLTFVITPSWIKTSKETGYLMLSYQAIPVDVDGYPLVPDDEAFSEALYWYINMKLMYPQWKEGRVRDAVYYDARRSWNYYCKQAYGNAMMPDGEKLESIKNAWLRLVPNINEHETFFSNVGQQQNIYNANR